MNRPINEITKTCPDCDCVLELTDSDGGVSRFTKHDTEFCRLGIKLKLRATEVALKMANERANYAEERLVRLDAEVRQAAVDQCRHGNAAETCETCEYAACGGVWPDMDRKEGTGE